MGHEILIMTTAPETSADRPAALQICGEVERAEHLTAQMLAALPERWQIADVSQHDRRRRGRAVWLAGLLELAVARPVARYLTVYAGRDGFHACVPLEAVRERSLVIYELDGQPLPAEQGGPFRFLVLDAAQCKTAEIDECVNVKYVDRLELTSERTVAETGKLPAEELPWLRAEEVPKTST